MSSSKSFAAHCICVSICTLISENVYYNFYQVPRRTMSDPPPPLLPQGRATRARGRARITPQHELDNIRMPGSMPLGTVGPDGLVTIHDLPGRGRASTPSSGSRGRGVTPERDPPQSTAPVGHGRGTFMRGGPAAQTQESVGSTGATR